MASLKEMRNRIFTKFWKHGTSGGSGLGMYIVGGLTRAHGGHVTVRSRPGRTPTTAGP